ncbi:MAG TPA: hypothetical protein VKA92_04090 [Segetibacter sp.]|nr:hypothetical protein [Segetibacter sp.]
MKAKSEMITFCSVLKVVKIFADGGYRGQLINTIKTQFKMELEIIKRDELHTFKILPK